jgi:hypothetical protein
VLHLPQFLIVLREPSSLHVWEASAVISGGGDFPRLPAVVSVDREQFPEHYLVFRRVGGNDVVLQAPSSPLAASQILIVPSQLPEGQAGLACRGLPKPGGPHCRSRRGQP